MSDRNVPRDVAIVGYGCRLPGAQSPEDLWSLLDSGRCAVGEIPSDRWAKSAFLNPSRNAAGTTYTLAAGVLEDAFGFDAGFFGVSPREAAQMDPQQRLLMMVAWEAIEMAGMTPAQLAGSRTGVYVGASGLDYGNTLHGDPSLGDAQFMTGNTLSIIANRLAHFLDASGPSYVIDTACSSSLFAFHAAFEAIGRGEIDRAVVGGVNLLMSPMPFVGFCRAGMLSPTGLCRPFDAGADGYVRAEGAVAFVIEAAETAREAGDRIRSVVAGSAVNSDGRVGPLSVPNGVRQAELMRRVLASAGLSADDLAFVEAHGTGTAVGDPIEARAIGEALGSGRTTPLPVGSVKSNFGHLEPASGLAGLLKAQLALEKGVLPATLHVRRTNPAIDLDGLNLALATEPLALPSRDAPWAAAVNSFGFGGANAHVAIRQPDRTPSAEATPRAGAPLILSAQSAEALRCLAGRWRDRLSAVGPEEAAALVSLAAHRRARLPRRLVVAEPDAAATVAALDAFASGRDGGRWASETAPADSAPVAFVFSGNGSQWPGMGRAAYRDDAAFRESFDATAAQVEAEGGVRIVEALHAPDLDRLLGEAEVAQPLLTAIQIAIVEALAARGVRPAMVAGHSVGEVAAAWACGAIDRAQAARLSVRRARAQAPLHGAGGMAALLAPREAVEALVAEEGIVGLDVAADNSPRGVTVSGTADAIEAIVAAARRRRLALRRLKVDYPFHGPLMERIRDVLLAALAGLTPREARIPFISTTEGRETAGTALDAGYWWRNARKPVLFREATLALSARGARVFLEIGPQPSLQSYVTDTLAPEGVAHAALPSFRRQSAAAEDLGLIAARVAAAGGAVDDATLFGPRAPVSTEGPRYPWRLRPYRLETTRGALNVFRRPAARGLLGWRAVEGEGAWRVTLDLAAEPWLADHVVDETPTLPAAAFAEMALAAAAETYGDGPLELVDFDIVRAAAFDGGARLEMRTSLDAETGALRIESRPIAADAPWALNAMGTARRAAVGGTSESTVARPGAAAAEASAAPDGALYDELSAIGLVYGPAFRRAGAPRGVDGALTSTLSPSTLGEAGPWVIDPTDLDSAFHVSAPLLREDLAGEDGVCLLPVRIGRLVVRRPGAAATQASARLARRGDRGAAVDFALSDASGETVAEARGVRFQAVRLRRRRELSAMLWRSRLRPRRAGPLVPSATPAAWADPVRRLKTLGVASDHASEPDDATLLRDALGRRIGLDAARRLAPEGGVRRAARDRLSPALAGALDRCLDALAADGGYDPATDALTAEEPAPPLAALVSAIAAAAPQDATTLLDGLGLAEAFASASQATHQTADGAAASSPREDAAGWDALAAAVSDLADGWSDTDPFDALVVGSPPERLLAAFGDAASRLMVAENAEALSAALAEAPFDVVILDDAPAWIDDATLAGCAAALAPGGLLLGSTGGEDLLRDMLALAGGARTRRVDPVGRLGAVGLETSIASSADRNAPRSIFVARRPALEKTDAPMAEPRGRIGILARPGEAAAAALRQAFAALGVRASVVSSTDGLIAGDAAVVFDGALSTGVAADSESAAIAARIIGLRDVAEAVGDARTWLVAPGALTGDGAGSAGAAALARVRRVLANERPGFRLGVIDVESPIAQAAEIAAAVTEPYGETEIAIRGGRRAVPRVEPARDVSERAALRIAGPEPALALRPDAAGGLETLRWRAVPRRAPGAGEIEIAVSAGGLNFRDVMWAMGVLPEEAVEDGFAGAGIGMECAGVVTRVGPGARLREGDRVIAFAASALATHVTVSEGAAAALPDGVDMAAAATLPVVFGTAWRGLVELGRLEPGETALIHGGAGGVGLAALQIARERGARIIATAGSPEKRALARMLGADLAFDSRSLSFADETMAATGGRGVDVALNSLSGPAMERTLSCMSAFGRFIELGKRDFYANTRVGLRPLRRNVSYFGVDLDALLRERPEAGGRLLEEVSRGLAERRFAPLPYRRYPADEAIAAFRLMQRAGHVGKIVVAPPEAPAEKAEVSAPFVRAEGAYVVTGGARGFGLAVAERLVRRGARRLWLTSRGGDGDAEGVARLRRLGASVELVACDAANEQATARLLARIDAAGAPLHGVVHAAMALDDGLMESQSAERVAASLRPKLAGAQALDRLTRGLPLDFFVMLSSVSALFGNPGQGPYVAANAALEAVAARRRSEGLPGLAMGFGPIADAGVLAGDVAARERLERRGAAPIPSAVALDALETALAGAAASDVALTVADMRWGALAAELPVLRERLFERVDRTAAALSVAEGRRDLAELLDGLDEAAAVARLTALFRAEAATILRQAPEEIDPQRPLSELGFDSLMGMELKLTAEEKFGVALPAHAMAEGASLSTMAARLVAAHRVDRQAPADGQDEQDIAAFATRHVAGAAARRMAGALAAHADGAGS